jgi:hypothetical protein
VLGSAVDSGATVAAIAVGDLVRGVVVDSEGVDLVAEVLPAVQGPTESRDERVLVPTGSVRV